MIRELDDNRRGNVLICLSVDTVELYPVRNNENSIEITPPKNDGLFVNTEPSLIHDGYLNI